MKLLKMVSPCRGAACCSRQACRWPPGLSSSDKKKEQQSVEGKEGEIITSKVNKIKIYKQQQQQIGQPTN